MTHGNDCCRIAKQVEPFRVAPRVQIVNGLACKAPTSLLMPKRGNGRGRTQQNWILPHLRKELSPQCVPTSPGPQQLVTAKFWLGRRPLEKLLHHGSLIVLTTVKHRLDEHSAHFDETFLPEHARLFQACGTKRF